MSLICCFKVMFSFIIFPFTWKEREPVIFM
jgi:hypothetical protein